MDIKRAELKYLEEQLAARAGEDEEAAEAWHEADAPNDQVRYCRFGQGVSQKKDTLKSW